MRLIDADALMADIKECIEIKYANSEYEQLEGLEIALSCVDEQPTIEERKRGKWTQILNADKVTHDYRCSECHRYRFHNGEMRKKYKFCPNCGARMENADAVSRKYKEVMK